MRDRLIELLENCGRSQMPMVAGLELWADDIADYLLENEVIVPPCKVGDTVYYPSFNVGMVFEYKIVSIKLNSKGLYVVLDNRLRNEQMTHRASQIGKTVFLTKEQAEQALAEVAK